MTIVDAVSQGERVLATKVASARVDAELLMRHVLSCGRSDLYSGSRQLDPAELADFHALVARRASGEPLQYVTGSQSFRHMEIMVGPGVLVPRPETEWVVEVAIELIAQLDAPRVLDLGTGSGAIALAIASEMPSATVIASDVSADALKWAAMNKSSQSLKNVELIQSDLFSGFDRASERNFDLIVSNPPYLSEAQLESSETDVRDHEPRIAFVSGSTGLEVPSRIVEDAPAWLDDSGWLVIETWPGQIEDLASLMRSNYIEIQMHDDLGGNARVIAGKKR